MDKLGLQIVCVGVSKIFVLVCKVVRTQLSRCGFQSVRYLEVKVCGESDSVRCSEFGGGRF